MNIRRAYNALLRLYPSDHRAVFADEMLSVFEQASEESRMRGRAGLIRFAVAELSGTLMCAGAERVAKLAYDVYRSANLTRHFYLVADWVAKLIYAMYYSNSSFRSRCVPDLRMVRPAGVSWESWYGTRTDRS
jgi:hypothetical protein